MVLIIGGGIIGLTIAWRLTSIGKKVIHKKYGTGIVEEVNGNEITVNFGDEHGIKHLDIEWAPIEFE